MITYMIRRKTDGMYVGSNGYWNKVPKLYGEEQLQYAIKKYNSRAITEEARDEKIAQYVNNPFYNHLSYDRYKDPSSYTTYKDIELIRDVNGVRDVVWSDTKCDKKAKDLFIKSNTEHHIKEPAIPRQIAETGIETEIGLLLGEIEHVEKKLQVGKLWDAAELEAKIELKTMKLEAASKQLITRFEELKNETRRKLDA